MQNLNAVIRELEAERNRIDGVIRSLRSLNGGKPGRPSILGVRRRISAAGRARIAAAQRARWAKAKKH